MSGGVGLEIRELGLSGCYELRPPVFRDARGSFVKTFHSGQFRALGLPTAWLEEYYSVSRKGVVRGMHLQLPPMQHSKMVYCLQGAVLDVLLDLRPESRTYGEAASLELSAAAPGAVLIPEGVAHGFCALSDEALVHYKATSVHSPEHDTGVRWNSFGFPWPVERPVVSERDRRLPPLSEFAQAPQGHG